MYLDATRFAPSAGGTADFAVSAAVPGYMTPATAGAADGGTYYYRAESIDLAQWEIGIGTYAVSGATLARTTVLFSSSSNAKVNFSTAPQVAVVALAEGLREKLAAARTYYVNASTGNDNNSGLTSGTAFATIQKAFDTVANTLDLNGNNVTIQLAAGTYGAGGQVFAPWIGVGNVTLLGDATTPSNVVVPGITVGASPNTVVGSNGARLFVSGIRLTSGITATEGSLISINGPMEYAMTGNQITAQRFSTVYIFAGYTISSGGIAHYNATTNGAIISTSAITVTLTGSPVFTTGFGFAGRQSRVVIFATTFSGATGASSPRYSLKSGGLVDVNGQGTSYLPGTVAGTNDGTGIYV
jgi:hypothetical protein